ncbi:hypothetical protein Dimus_039750 [Dionaea muscipula]
MFLFARWRNLSKVFGIRIDRSSLKGHGRSPVMIVVVATSFPTPGISTYALLNRDMKSRRDLSASCFTSNKLGMDLVKTEELANCAMNFSANSSKPDMEFGGRQRSHHRVAPLNVLRKALHIIPSENF